MKYLLVRLQKRTSQRMKTMANKLYAMKYDLILMASSECEVDTDKLSDSDPFKSFLSRFDSIAQELMDAYQRQQLPTDPIDPD